MHQRIRKELAASARMAHPEEACGMLVGRREGGRVVVTRSVPCVNTATPELRARRFEIDPRRVIEEERLTRGVGEEVVGFYHSHPQGDPVPSRVDRPFMALWPEAVWVIVGPGGRALKAWNLAAESTDDPEELPIGGPS